MKQILIFVTIFSLFSCENQAKKQSNNEQTLAETEEFISSSIPIPTGNWFYSAYIDSTIFHKSIFKFSYTCASFAYQISYDTNNPDSIHFIGYHEKIILPLIKKDDKTYWAGDDIQHWVLKFNDNFSKFALKEYIDPTYTKKAEPKTYYFNLTENKIASLSKHFVSNILKGVYENDTLQIELTEKLNEKSAFTDFYKLKGIDEFKTYSIAIDFVEMIPQMDLIYFYNKDGNSTSYNWSFDNDDLILKHVEIIHEDGDFVGGKPTEVAFRLRKVTK